MTRTVVAIFTWLSAPALALGQAPVQQAQPPGGAAGALREVTATAIPGIVAATALFALWSTALTAQLTLAFARAGGRIVMGSDPNANDNLEIVFANGIAYDPQLLLSRVKGLVGWR